jgi:small subunit ribosomal protein S6
MATQRTANYEGLFLLSQAEGTNLAAASEHIGSLLTRRGATIIAMKKWDERRLAYEINKQRRGTYILAYFNSPTAALQEIERDCNLSEVIMRQIIIRADHLSEDEMRAADGREELRTEAALRSQEEPAPAGRE